MSAVPVVLAVAALVAGLFWCVRPGAVAARPDAPQASRDFLADGSAWGINLALGVIGVLAGAVAAGTEDFGMRLAALSFAVFGGTMAAVECGRRLAHIRRIAAR